MTEPFKDSKHLADSADVMGRCCKSWQSSTAQYHFAVRDMIREQADALEALQAERDRLREALTPSADTKADYMGEFYMSIRLRLRHEEEHRSVQIPWTSIKEIMKAIRTRAALGGDT